METRACQNCKNDFTIEPDDFSFYEKIGVPAPTFCPECRMVRRMMWRNVRSLYKRACDLCQKTLISMYSDSKPQVYCSDCWNSDAWNPLDYGQEYDESKTFFAQLKELFYATPVLYQYRAGNMVNSDFSNYTIDNKNVYLAYSIIGCEDTMYSETIEVSKNSLDCYAGQKLDSCYYNVDCENNYNAHYMVKSQTCIDSFFLFDCWNCQDCFMSSNLRNQRYVFMNKKLSKEAYDGEMKKLSLGSFLKVHSLFKEFNELMKFGAIHRFAQLYNSQESTGDYISNSRGIKRGFDIWSSENVAYSMRTTQNVKDSYDVQGTGRNCELIYECMASSINTYKNKFGFIVLSCRECEYCLDCRSCSNCFGCIGMKNAQYCILNKQYEKDEYFEMIEKIKKHMDTAPYVDAKGRVYTYGEFFPYDMSPFGYNETNAHDFFPLTYDEASGKGYTWKNRDQRDYRSTVSSDELIDNINNVDDMILDEIIECPNAGSEMTQCTTAFKIVPNELQFYRQKNIPLPRYCPNCRHYERLKYRNPMRLYTRTCSNGCGTQFQTTYAPDRPEKVYCETCYQKEVL